MSGSPSSLEEALAEHVARSDNPHGTSPQQIGAYTKAETDAAISSAVNDLANVSVQAMELAAEAALRQNADKANSDAIAAHAARSDNPHGMTPDQIGAAPKANPKFTGLAEFQAYNQAYATPTIVGGVLTLNLSAANVFVVNRTANITSISITNPPAAGRAASFTLILAGDGVERSIVWPTSIRWASGAAPEPTHTAALRDMLVFMSVDQGTTWLGMTTAQRF